MELRKVPAASTLALVPSAQLSSRIKNVFHTAFAYIINIGEFK